ncbi:MAG: ABC transporter ATP-binding protein [Anaerolineales bacterium]|nr:ABC transporter ATP-binding protein [Anaerolineales bacterium]
METSAVIHTIGLKKNYGITRALRGLTLEVQPGEIFGFLGPNGAGKTTTIRCLLDLIRPNGGEVRVLGLNPRKDPVAVRARTGYLPGELHFDENMTVEGALRFLNRLRGGKADWGHIGRICERIHLDLRQAIRNLSKGNKQKVGVVQALMHKPELLILDEPTFGLDPLVQREVLRLVREARQDGATVFFSSHILSEVQEIADRVGIIRKGILAEVADKAALMGRSLLRARIRFREKVDAKDLAGLPGITILDQENGRSLTIQIEGEMDRLIKALAAYPVMFFESERPSLEEIFLSYYTDGPEKKS